jgi:G5 domain
MKILTYEVTLTNGVRTGTKLISKVMAKAPVTRVIVVGTKEAQRCDPNYSGACAHRQRPSTVQAVAATARLTGKAPSAWWEQTSTGSTPTATVSAATAEPMPRTRRLPNQLRALDLSAS